MKSILIASASALALLGLSACADTDETTTQSFDQPEQVQPAPAEPMAVPPVEPAPANGAPADEIRPVE